jgi:hypothetical protein
MQRLKSGVDRPGVPCYPRAMANHRETAARIWRTIVCSGAMLAVPLTADAGTGKTVPPQANPAPTKTAAPAPEPAKQAPSAPRPPGKFNAAASAANELETEAAAQKSKAEAWTEAAKLAKGATDSQALAAKAIEQYHNGKTEPQRVGAYLVLQRLAQVSPEGTEQDLFARLDKAIQAVTNAQNDADRNAARTKLTALEKELADLRNPPRPRAQPRERPIGRGFVLA